MGKINKYLFIHLLLFKIEIIFQNCFAYISYNIITIKNICTILLIFYNNPH